ncbi:MAG: serine/threonine protein kinase [Gemmataceae bacterium]|nr:serine/threonine protein kinase [Gemmataceae bacterium]
MPAMPDRSTIPATPTLAPPRQAVAHTMVQTGEAPTTATPAPLAAMDPLSLGRIGDYEIQDKLGEGGMGAVYRGYDTQLHRNVAIKLLLPEYSANREARERFLREARSAAAISHDNVVTIFHVGDHRGSAYLVMPLLKGMSLEAYFARKGLPTIPQSIRFAREIAAGLAAAHRQGLIHRDVKPGNVWLEAPNGRVKILDFGIAKPIGAERKTALTEAGVVMGTPAFMSPEQARGHAVDSRSDLFSLGAILYRLLAGTPPFVRPTVMETLTALVSEEPAPLRQRNPDVPPPLADLVHRLLARDPAARPDSAEVVIRELRAIERGHADDRKATSAIAVDAAVRISGEMPTIPPDVGFEVVEPEPAVTRSGPRKRRKRKRDATWPMVVGAACVAAIAVVAMVVYGIVKSVGKSGAPEQPAADNPKLLPAVVPQMPEPEKVVNPVERPQPEMFPRPPLPWPPPPGFGPRPPGGKFLPPPSRDKP